MEESSCVIFDLVATQPLRNNRHGGGEYAKTVFKTLLAKVSTRKFIAFYSVVLPIDENLLCYAQRYGVELVGISRQSDIANIIKMNPGSIFYSSIPYHYHNIDFCNVNVVFTIHGLRPIESASDWYEYKYYKSFSDIFKWLVRSVLKKTYIRWRISQFRKLLSLRAQHVAIVVPSQHTKCSLLLNFTDLKASNITVLYSPVTAVEQNIPSHSLTLVNYDLSERSYILLVSGNRWIKNAYRGLLALEQLIEKFTIQKKIVIVGGAPSRISCAWQNKFMFLPYVSDEELVLLYKNAFCLLYPTLNEGFGYPPLEAMRHGTPVICSSVASLPEILGDAPLYFSPFSCAEMENRILNLLIDDRLWDLKSGQGLKCFKQVVAKQQTGLEELCNLILNSANCE